MATFVNDLEERFGLEETENLICIYESAIERPSVKKASIY